MREVGADLARWRRLIVEEIRTLKEELVEETEKWLEHLPDHGKVAYKSKMFPNVPLWRSSVVSSASLTLAHFSDMTHGFTTLGRLHQGVCWDVKEDWDHRNHLIRIRSSSSTEDLSKAFFPTRKPDDHANTLLKTLLRGRSEGKVSGPYKALLHWKVQSVAPDKQQPLLNYPFNEAAASVAF